MRKLAMGDIITTDRQTDPPTYLHTYIYAHTTKAGRKSCRKHV